MTSSFEHFFWQQRELYRALESMRPALDALDNVPGSIIDSVAKLDLLQDRFMFPPDYLASTRKIQELLASSPVIESLELLSGLDSPTMRTLQGQQYQIDEILRAIAPSTSGIDATMQHMINSVASTEALLGLQRLSGPLVEVVLQPQLAFQEFAKKYLDLAAAGSEIARQNRLLLVDASAGILDSVKKGFDLAALMCPSHEDLWVGASPRVNVYSALDHEFEFLDLEEPSIDAESVVEASSSGMVAAIGAQLVRLVYNLNVEAEREGKVPVFKPTTKTLMACALIPSHVAFDRASFNEITDHLFFLLYEGSGSAQRLTTRLDERKLEALWMLKHLRLGSRHDIDHGTEREIEKKNLQVGEAYKRLVGSVAPRSRKEWMSAQVALYKELVKMLEQVWFGEGD